MLEQQQQRLTARTHAAPRVLMVTARYWPLIGGVETHVHEVAWRLAEAGAAVTVCTTDPSGALPREEQRRGVQIVRVPAWPKGRDYYFAPGIAPIISGGQWDVVHIQGYHTLVAPLAMWACQRANVPYVVSFHSGGSSSRLRVAARDTQRALLRPLLARAARLIAVSEFEAEAFQRGLRLPPDQFTVIPNGAQLPQVPAGVAPSGGPLLVSVGRLERYKGHQRVIAALPYVLKAHPDARLRIVGGGPYQAELERQAAALGLAARVEIGAIPPSDRDGMAAVVARAALVVLLSEYEAHPIAVMEALALGRPVLVNAQAGLKEIADRGLAAAVQPTADAATVGAAIVAELAREHTPLRVQLPTWERCTDALLDVYGQVTR